MPCCIRSSAAPDGAMGKRTGTDKSDYSDKSDGNGAIFTLNSNASEELKRQVKAMQACVGAFFDLDGAEYARRFKEKYGIANNIVSVVLRPTGAKHTPLFLKKDGGLGEGKNFFSREKKFFPSPKKSPLLAFSGDFFEHCRDIDLLRAFFLAQSAGNAVCRLLFFGHGVIG